MDFDSYPHWNPFVTEITGEAHEGARLKIRIQPPGRRAMTFKPTVRRVDPPSELSWIGRVLIPGIFDGEHALRVEPLEDGRSRFIHRERFTGVLVPFLGGTLDKTERGFEQMNAALKARVEESAAQT